MKKIFIPVLTFLMLISFVSCNLDNNGILWTGINRYPSDDKDRNFIGYSETTGKLYYTTVDGLSEFDPANEDSNSEHVLSSNDIFINNSPDIAWLTQNGDKIIYVDDYVEGYRNPKQDYWIYNLQPNDGEATLKEITDNIKGLEAGYGLIDTFISGNNRYVVAQNGETIQLYTVSLNNGETLSFTASGSKIDYYVDSLNGLIWSKKTNSNISDLAFRYIDKDVIFKSNDGKNDVVLKYDKDDENQGNQIKAVYVNNDTMVVLRYADDDTVYVYEGSTSGSEIILNYVGTITEDLPSIVPSFINDNKLYFLKYNSSRSSELYIVTLDEFTAHSYTTDVAGLRAEAFFLADGNVFILTKDKGVFRIDGTAVTPVPDLRRR